MKRKTLFDNSDNRHQENRIEMPPLRLAVAESINNKYVYNVIVETLISHEMRIRWQNVIFKIYFPREIVFIYFFHVLVVFFSLSLSLYLLFDISICLWLNKWINKNLKWFSLHWKLALRTHFIYTFDDSYEQNLCSQYRYQHLMRLITVECPLTRDIKLPSHIRRKSGLRFIHQVLQPTSNLASSNKCLWHHKMLFRKVFNYIFTEIQKIVQ